MISEDRIIQALRRKSKGFIGDDAAILPSINHGQYAVCKDLLIQDVHFRTTYFSAKDLAHKALHVNLSDLAAMGASPLYILCGISMPQNLGEYACDVLDHLTDACKKAGVILIGGDTTASKGELFISITAIGKVQSNHIKHRSTAQSDDLICIAGNLGWAHLGFTALERASHINEKYMEAFLRPLAKVKEGVWLAQQTSVTSMMDLSDGLYIDLKRLCEASSRGAVINLDHLPSNTKFEETCKILALEALETMLVGGEDYGLLFTVDKHAFDELSGNFSKIFKYELKAIGRMAKGSKVVFCQNGRGIDLHVTPFTHFGEEYEI